MKIAVISLSGNVGKSTLSRHVLSPRLNALYIPIETVNVEGTEDLILRGKQFNTLLDAMAVEHHVVVDVGASNVEEFFAQMKNYQGSHEDFDLFVIPTVSAPKQQRDTIHTVWNLVKLAVEESKIRIVFNMVDNKDNLNEVFASIFELRTKFPGLKLDADIKIANNDLFPKLLGTDITIEKILADPTDFKALMNLTEDKAKRLELSQRRGVKLLALGLNDELNAVFSKLIA